MESLEYAQKYLERSLKVKEKLLNDDKVIKDIAKAADLVTSGYKKNKKLMLAGNGGSAADSQHIAAEFVSRFFYDRPGLPAIALTTDTSMITAIGRPSKLRKGGEIRSIATTPTLIEDKR